MRDATIHPAPPRTQGVVRNRRSPWAARGELPQRVTLVLAALGFILPCTAWALLSVSGWVDPVFLPGPVQVVQSIGVWFTEGDLLGDLLVSIGRVYGGFALAVVIALPMGIAIGTLAPVRALLAPAIDFSRYLPAVAFIPLIMLWVGIEESAKITVIFVGTFAQMVRRIPRARWTLWTTSETTASRTPPRRPG